MSPGAFMSVMDDIGLNNSFVASFTCTPNVDAADTAQKCSGLINKTGFACGPKSPNCTSGAASSIANLTESASSSSSAPSSASAMATSSASAPAATAVAAVSIAPSSLPQIQV